MSTIQGPTCTCNSNTGGRYGCSIHNPHQASPTPPRNIEGWGQRVAGRCPACGSSGTLFVAVGQHITCSLDVCPDPTAVADLLNGDRNTLRPAARPMADLPGVPLSSGFGEPPAVDIFALTAEQQAEWNAWLAEVKRSRLRAMETADRHVIGVSDSGGGD